MCKLSAKAIVFYLHNEQGCSLVKKVEHCQCYSSSAKLHPMNALIVQSSYLSLAYENEYTFRRSISRQNCF